MGHAYEVEKRTCNWHLRHIASAKLPKAHSREHVLAIMSRISMHSLTTASWHLFPNTERSLGSLETGHTPNLKLRSHKNVLLRYLINHACLLAYSKWERLNDTKIIHFSLCTLCTKKYLKYILMYSSAYSKREILRVLEEASANISWSRNIFTTPLYTDSEIQRQGVPRKHSDEQQVWLALWLWTIPSCFNTTSSNPHNRRSLLYVLGQICG